MVRQHLLVVFVLATLSLVVYATRVAEAPLRPDEIQLRAGVGLLAAHEGHDGAGRFLPLFVQVSPEVWLEPIPIYGSLLLSKTGISRISPERWLAVLAGTMDIILIYFLAARLFHSSGLGCVAAIFLLVSPAHVIHSRVASIDSVWVLPFVLAWLLALATLLGRAPRLALAIGGAALAAGMYSQPSATILMLILMTATIIGVYRAGRLSWNELWFFAGAVGLGLMPLAAWYAIHPSSYLDTFGRWVLHPAHVRNPVALAQAVTNWYSLTTWVGTYWDFFNPAHLLIDTTAQGWAGVFLLPVGVLIGVGLHEMTRHRLSKLTGDGTVLWIIALGFVAAPLVAASFKEPRAIQRALAIVPFGAVIATVGIQSLWAKHTNWSRAIILVMLAAGLVQFSLFYGQLIYRGTP